MTDLFSEVLRRRAAHEPDGIAVVDETGATTNAELDRAVDAIAHEVAASGAARVAVIASNSTSFLAHAFGVWRAGRTLVTVYPSSPEAEIDYALGHADVGVVFADEESAARVPARWAVRALDRHLPGSGPFDADAVTDTVTDADAQALICYTSGSTQRPKAVVHTHRSVLGGARAYAEVWHLGPDDTTLVVLPMAWAFGLVTTSMAALVSGGRVRSVRRARADALLPAIGEDEVTFVAGVTTIFAKMVEALRAGASVDGHRIRLCISGGEPRNELVFDEWRSRTGVPVHDVYAASECFPVVTYDPVRDPEPTPGFAGRVAPGSALRLWDEAREVFSDGPGTGEAFVRGAAFFSGYLGDSETTAAALTADGWYRTGDLVEVRPDGLVRVLGRLSGMIIRGGANVAPAEIERVVREAQDVEDAAAIGLPDHDYGQRIVVAVTGHAGAVPDRDAIMARCRRDLAGYKVPQDIVVLEALPINDRTGKLDRRALERELAGRPI